jgi:hypothetical protein
MKKVFFIIGILLISLNVFAQSKINTSDLIGYWQPSEESTQLFFWKDTKGVLQVQDISGTSGDPLDVMSFEIYKDSVFVKTIFVKNNWIVESTITLLDKTTLKRVVSGKIPGIIIYKKIK